MFSIHGINSASLAERAREVLSMMQRRGIRVPSNNRLTRAAVFTDHVNDRYDAGRCLPADSDLLKRVTEAWRTMWEAFVVMHAATQGRASSKVLDNDLLESFLRGADIPTEDSSPLPRSTQFEAFTAANLVHSGLSVARDEPDFRFQFYDETVGVAVKRLTSIRASKVYDEIRDASNQMRGQGLRGFVALSLDNWIEDLGDDMKDAAAVGASFNAQLMDAHRQLMKLSERPVLLGAFISINWSQWVAVEGRPYLQWSAPDQTLCFTENEEQVTRSREFFEPARIRWHQSLAEAAALVS